MTAAYDIAVVGAGPAGSSFARVLSSASDYRIAVIDGSTFYGKPCGGLLSPDAQQILARCNITLPRDVLTDPQIFAVRTIDIDQNITRYYPRMYVNMDRKRFDEWLVSLIPEKTDIIKGKCLGISAYGGGYRLKVRVGDDMNEIKCRYIVGADGANSAVRKFLCGGDKKHKIKYYNAIQQYFRIDRDKISPFYSCVFDSKTSDSCSWSINKGDYFIFGGAFAPHKCRENFEIQKKKFFDHIGMEYIKPERTEACKVYSVRKMSDFYTGRENAFLIGEAAGFISPSSFEGISNAMESGILLADAFRSDDKRKCYERSVRHIKRKLHLKCFKRSCLCSPFLRKIIMKSGITAINLYDL